VFASSTAAASSAPEPAPAAASNGAEATNAAAGDKLLTEAEARKIAEEVGHKVAVQVAQQLLQQQPANAQTPTDTTTAATISDADVHHIAQAEVAKAVDDQATGAAPAPVEPAKPKAAAKDVAEAAPVEPAQAEPKAARAKPPRSASAAARDHSLPAGNIAWWAPANGAANGFGLSFAGEAASTRAIALLFSMPIGNAAVAGSRIKVINPAGKTEPGLWTLAPNPRMMILHVAAPGRYLLTVGADVPSSEGKTLGKTVKGPVYVH